MLNLIYFRLLKWLFRKLSLMNKLECERWISDEVSKAIGQPHND